MIDFKETGESTNTLLSLAIKQDEARRKIIKDSSLSRSVTDLWGKWQALNEQALKGERLILPGSHDLERIIPTIWRQTMATGREHSTYGLLSGDDFFWSDIAVGDEYSALVTQISRNGVIIASTPPQYFDILDKPVFVSDSGEPMQTKLMIHTHGPMSTNFFSGAEFPGFESSQFAKEAGIIGLVTTFNTFMATGNNGGKDVKLYCLTKDGHFGLAVQNKTGDLLVDYFDDSVSYLDRKKILQIALDT